MKTLHIVVNVLFIIVGFCAFWVWENSVPDYSKEQ